MKEIDFKMAWKRLEAWIAKREIWSIEQVDHGVKLTDFGSRAIPCSSVRLEEEEMLELYFDSDIRMFLHSGDTYQLAYTGESGTLVVSRSGGSETRFHFMEGYRPPTRDRRRTAWKGRS